MSAGSNVNIFVIWRHRPIQQWRRRLGVWRGNNGSAWRLNNGCRRLYILAWRLGWLKAGVASLY
jgi:hypothetical protein